jgi:hypothetical protein
MLAGKAGDNLNCNNMLDCLNIQIIDRVLLNTCEGLGVKVPRATRRAGNLIGFSPFISKGNRRF